MQALTEERWAYIRSYVGWADDATVCDSMLQDLLQQYDHLAAQIKLLADYIMSERPDDPAWSMGEGACAMAVEIMKREAKALDALGYGKNAFS